MMQKFTILFDLDGTLVNTAPDLMNAHNYVMKKYGYDERNLSDIKKLAGRGSKVMLTRSMHEIAELSGKVKKTDDVVEKMTKEFVDFYSKNIFKESFWMAIDAIRQNKLRSILTLLGISIGVFSVIGVMTAIRTLESSVESGLNVFAANTFVIQKYHLKK